MRLTSGSRRVSSPLFYDLLELGRYYLGYRELADHFTQSLGRALHTVRYEQLVADTEREIRSLLAYCGLEWESACLNFHENKAASTTASAVQVRQPIYGTSVGKWKLYQNQLEPLAELLRTGGIPFE